MADEILVEAVNTIECSPDEPLELAADIQAVVPDIPVVVGYEDEEGSGVAIVFALHLFLPSIEFLKGALYTEIWPPCLPVYVAGHATDEDYGGRSGRTGGHNPITQRASAGHQNNPHAGNRRAGLVCRVRQLAAVTGGTGFRWRSTSGAHYRILPAHR